MIRNTEAYPYAIVKKGMEKAGYVVENGEDVLVSWTPWKNSLAYKRNHKYRQWFVFENGYIPTLRGMKYYSMGVRGINGTDMFIPNYGRNLGIRINKSNNQGSYILVLGQFGHTDTRYSMPRNWPVVIINMLKKVTSRKIIYRPKPVNNRGALPINVDIDNTTNIDEQIRNACAVVTWNSPSCAVKAIINNIPVYIDAPNCIVKPFSISFADIDNPISNVDEDFFNSQLSNTTWSVEEIEQGQPFKYYDQNF